MRVARTLHLCGHHESSAIGGVDFARACEHDGGSTERTRAEQPGPERSKRHAIADDRWLNDYTRADGYGRVNADRWVNDERNNETPSRASITPTSADWSSQYGRRGTCRAAEWAVAVPRKLIVFAGATGAILGISRCEHVATATRRRVGGCVRAARCERGAARDAAPWSSDRPVCSTARCDSVSGYRNTLETRTASG